MRTAFCHKSILALFAATGWTLLLYAQEGNLSGTIRNDTEVVPAATVSVADQTVLTDQDGRFSFSLEPGMYTLRISHTGYKKIEQSITIEAGSRQQLDFSLVAIDLLEAVTVGSRSLIRRSPMNQPLPVDVIPAQQLQQTGQVSLSQMLTFVAPSFNASREVLHEPATLRGLDPQHLLLLLNNTRYHNMAFYFSGNLKGQLGRGSVANDLNSIPFSAIEEVEILRNGASAQYGSDAIGGVINIKLKKVTSNTSIQVNTGRFYHNDGDKFSLGLYHGFSLGKKNAPPDRRSFLALAANYRYQEPTFHGGTYEGLVYYDTARRTPREKDSLLQLDDQMVAERGFDRRKAVDNIGNSKLSTYGLSLNGGYPVGVKTDIFWTARMNERKIARLAAYRFPKFRNQVNHFLYPDGFQPTLKSTTADQTLIGGVKGETNSHWHWDFRSSYGMNSVKSNSERSNNPTQTYLLGSNAQTSFYNGKDIYKLVTAGFNFSKKYQEPGGRGKLLNLAWGAEWRRETFISKNSEEAAWKNFDPANYPQFGEEVFENAIHRNRNILAAYMEAETEPVKRLLVTVAARYERHSHFGGNLGASLATIYTLSEGISLRASANNGFRTPSLQQRYITAVQVSNFNRGGVLVPGYRGLFSNDHPVTKAFGIPALTAEKSINTSSGITARLHKNLSLMVDAYWIQIKNRVILSGVLDRNNPDVGSILDSIAGIRVEQVQFFTNAIHTRTKGLDIVLNGGWKINKGSVGFTLAANFTNTRLFGDIKATAKLPVNTINSNSLFSLEEKTKMEEGQPASKIILTLTGKKGKAGFTWRHTRFGGTKTAALLDAKNYIFSEESFSAKLLTDLSLTYDLKKWVTLTIGSNNLFNVYPDPIKNRENTAQGILVYSPDGSPFGFNGGYYYTSMNFSF